MTYLYWKWDKAISKEQCDLILKNINWAQAEEGKTARKVNKTVRDTSVVWEPIMSVIGCIANTYIRSANVQAGWNFDLTETEGIQIGKYGVNGFYDWHFDSSIFNQTPRKISFSMLLNDTNEFTGGDFEFKEGKVDLQQGSIIVFPSMIKHRVTPVTKGVRYSAVTWMHGPNFK